MVALCVGALLAFAPLLPAQAPPISPNRPTIEGRVHIAGSNTPLQGVAVTLAPLSGGSRGTVITDGEGTFVFQDMPPGRYVITASHGEFQPGSLTVDFYGEHELGLRLLLRPKQSQSFVLPGATVPAWAVDIPKKAREEYDRAVEQLRKQNPKKSIEHFQKAIELYPQYATAHSGLGSAYLREGKRKEAEESYTAALKIDDSLLDASMGLGLLCLEQQRLPEAERHFLNSRKLRPDDWRIHHQLGEVYFAAGLLPAAETSLRRALELHSAAPRVHLRLINTFALQEKFSDALTLMDSFLKNFPDDSFAAQVREKREAIKIHLAGAAKKDPR